MQLFMLKFNIAFKILNDRLTTMCNENQVCSSVIDSCVTEATDPAERSQVRLSSVSLRPHKITIACVPLPSFELLELR